MYKVKIQGVRFNCVTGEPKCVELDVEFNMNPKLGMVVNLRGGPTGYESFCYDQQCYDDRKLMETHGWWACSGTERSWDALYIHGHQMKKLFHDFEEEDGENK